MRVVIIQDDFPPHSLGGAGNVAYVQAKALALRGNEVVVITATQDRTEVGAADFQGLEVYRVYANIPERWRGYRAVYNPRAVRAVRELLTQIEPDVVHIHNVHQQLSWGVFGAAKRSCAKVFFTAHDAMSVGQGKATSAIRTTAWEQLKKYRLRYNPLRTAIIRRYLREVKIFSVSNALATLLRTCGIESSVIHNGIDVGQWEVSADATAKFKEVHGLLGKKVILFGGRLSASKGGECAINMLPELAQLVPESVLLVMGNKTPYAEHLLARASELGVEEHIRFTGWLSGDSLRAAFHSADVVAVLSTYLDPFPTVNLEAMACHKPVVGTRFGGTPEAVVDGTTGYIVDPNDSHAVATHLGELLNDAVKAHELGKAGHARALDEFSLAHQVDKLLEAYSNSW